MIRNIIFDLGNVLLNYKPRDFLLKFTQDQQLIDYFVKVVNGSETWLDLDRGTISTSEARDHFISIYPEMKELILSYFEHWVEGLTPIQENINILMKLHEKGYKTYILSNYMKEPFEITKSKHDFFDLVDGMVISYQGRAIKPEKKIYQTLLSRYNLIPEECVFIDDHQNILDVAQTFGIKTILYHSKVDLREELRKLSVSI